MGGEEVKIASIGKFRTCHEEEQKRRAVTKGKCEIKGDLKNNNSTDRIMIIILI